MDGVLLCDKPAGPTSHDVVARVRRLARAASGERVRVGHAGTLDPFATGLLLVLVGRATRTQRYLMALPKTYETVARFGAVSTTGDPDGEITGTGAVPAGDLVLPTGELRQRPPAYSAIRIAGRRAYERARAGEVVDMPERTVTVSSLRGALARRRPRARFAIECSAGTYVRSLIADLGDAYCVELRRTAIGPFRVEDATAGEDPDVAACSTSRPRSRSCRASSSMPMRAGAPRTARRSSSRPRARRCSSTPPARSRSPSRGPVGCSSPS